MEAFDTPAVLSNLSKANPLNAEMPYLTILSATQPRILEGLMSDEDVHSGFINRWLIIPGKSEAPIAWPVSVDQQAALILFEQMHAAIHSAYPVGFAMELAEDARSFWEDWYEADWKRKQAPDEEAMRARYSTLIIKLALIYAVLNGDQVITRDNLERGIAFIDWMWAHVARMVPGWGSTLHGQLEHRIVQVLKEQGPMKQWRLSQLVSNKAMRDALVSTGVIAIDAAGVVGLRND
jgi:hypothetical protein